MIIPQRPHGCRSSNRRLKIQSTPFRDKGYQGKDFFLEKVLPVIKQSRIASNLASAIPIVGGPISKSIRQMGWGDGVLVDEGCGEDYGDGVMIGGVPAGGKMMRKKGKGAMRKRVAM